MKRFAKPYSAMGAVQKSYGAMGAVLTSECGFSLSETMVVLGIAAIMAVTLAAFSSLTFRSMSNVNKSGAIAIKMQDLQATLASARPITTASSTIPVTECTMNLQNTPLAMSATAGTTITQPLVGHDKTGIVQQTIATLGEVKDGITTQNIRLVPVAKIDTNMLLANLTLTFKKGEAVGPSTVNRSIPIFAKVESGKVVACWVRQDTATMIGSQICSATSIIGANLYDPMQDKCIAPTMAWFNGTSASAKCPPGDSLPGYNNPLAFCGVQTPPGWSDPGSAVDVTMSDGTVVPGRRAWVITDQDIANNTCNCHYATDIPGGDAASMVCQVKCIVP